MSKAISYQENLVISFGIKSLYTNVSVKDAIFEGVEKFYSDKSAMSPEDKEAFIILTELATANVLMFTHDGPLFKKRTVLLDTVLGELNECGKIDEQLLKSIKTVGGQLARLYGLVKNHKENISVRTILSIPGSSDDKVAEKIKLFLSQK